MPARIGGRRDTAYHKSLKKQDEKCDLNCVPGQAVRADITLALSNSLGFGGHNACLAFRKV